MADTVAGTTANHVVGKLKNGGTLASVLAAPTNASAYPDVKVEVMTVKPVPATLIRMAEAVKGRKTGDPAWAALSFRGCEQGSPCRRQRSERKVLPLA